MNRYHPGDLERLRHSVARGRPYGAEAWTRDTAIRLGLAHVWGKSIARWPQTLIFIARATPAVRIA